MSDDLEQSILEDLLTSGCIDEANAPRPQGRTIGEIAAGVEESEDKVREKLKLLASFNVVPVEECGDEEGPKRYRLEGLSEYRKYRGRQFPNSGWWAPED